DIVLDKNLFNFSAFSSQNVIEYHQYWRAITATWVNAGLSAARNLGAYHASGEIFAYTDDDCVPDRAWLFWLAKSYSENDFDLCGGPNLPPEPWDDDEAIIAAAPGAPSHVMLGDKNAEHIPGCNLSITREAFEKIGGFDERYWVAGDDVDFCWRAQALGLKIGFSGAAFVWHRRRATFLRYFKQQRGYGKAEAILRSHHSHKFNKDLASTWTGTIYQGGAASVHEGDFIYSGSAGSAAFQPLMNQVMPTRPLHRAHRSKLNLVKLQLAIILHPYLRAFSRIFYSDSSAKKKWYLYLKQGIQIKNHASKGGLKNPHKSEIFKEIIQLHQDPDAKNIFIEGKLSEGWKPSYLTEWDIEHPEKGRILVCNEFVGDSYWKLRVRTTLKMADL
ncbi:glycosyltransferase, partial [Akkermansiaceae bacterium]|nr:glycosyltransferase [Akkermansiaceae bacterium]